MILVVACIQDEVKHQQLMNEMKYGSQPVTAASRKRLAAAATPTTQRTMQASIGVVKLCRV